jgi:hypothetical protein
MKQLAIGRNGENWWSRAGEEEGQVKNMKPRKRKASAPGHPGA